MAARRPSPVSGLRGFNKGLRKDWAAVTAALTTPHSSDAVEGHVNRIKTIKRQVDGRAKPDLLRKRILLADLLSRKVGPVVEVGPVGPVVGRTSRQANRPILIEGDPLPVGLRRSRTPRAAK